ncbi:HNH endonuclease signature motif containing protein [Haloprofundus marisrubri]|uniref:HNH endonuclease signature motif containing protein n=1 Tax=Haloprofundus marisrubri TaxID=1514971 RepID=UPI0012BAFFDE|nr:HNH endonuclease signature motif containing protein [Haloprofundus marisrubri]
MDTKSIGRSSVAIGRNLKSEYRYRLRRYIETHPGYISHAKRQLQGDVKSLSNLVSDQDEETHDNSSTGTTEVSPLTDPLTSRSVSEVDFIQIGQITRFSNAHNAMVESRAGKERNIAGFPSEAEGDWVAITPGRGSFYLCLSPQSWDENYRDHFRRNAEYYEKLTGFDNLRNIQRIYSRSGKWLSTNSITKVTIIAVREDIGLAYKGPHTVIVESPGVQPETGLTVEIKETWGTIARAKPCTGNSEEPKVGETITVSNIVESEGVCWGTTNGQLVRLPVSFRSQSGTFQVGVKERFNDYLVGSVRSLSRNERPTVGEEVTVRNGQLVEYDSIPTEFPTGIPILEDSYQLEVVAVNNSGARVEFKKHIAKNHCVGEDIIVDPQRWGPDTAEAVKSHCPVIVKNSRYLPREMLRATITEFSKVGIIAEFTDVESAEDLSRQNPEELFEKGIQQLSNRDYSDATTTFAVALDTYENSEKSDNKTTGQLRFYECLSFAADQCQRDCIDPALRKLRTQFGPSISVGSVMRNEIEALRLSLKVNQMIGQLDKCNSAQATSNRSIARKHAKEAIDEFESIRHKTQSSNSAKGSENSFLENDRQYPHPVIKWILYTAAEDLLIAPASVTEYFEKHDCGDVYFTGDSETATENPKNCDPDNKSSNTELDTSAESKEKVKQEQTIDPILQARKQAYQFDIKQLSYKQRTRSDIEGEIPEPVIEYIHLRAGGCCEQCKSPATFEDRNGEPYLELHHQSELNTNKVINSDPEDILALCPTCHARAHHSD